MLCDAAGAVTTALASVAMSAQSVAPGPSRGLAAGPKRIWGSTRPACGIWAVSLTRGIGIGRGASGASGTGQIGATQIPHARGGRSQSLGLAAVAWSNERGVIC